MASTLPSHHNLVGFDLETHPIQPGILAPPIVCGSTHEDIFTAYKVPRMFAGIKLAGQTFAVANGAYDFGCVLAQTPKFFPDVWELYETRRVHDVLIFATLVAIAEGRLRDGELYSRKGKKMIDPSKGTITNRYNLSVVTQEWLGRDDAKRNDTYRTRYHELEHLPFSEWPEEALTYPVDDARNTRDAAIAQLEWASRTGFNYDDLYTQQLAAFCLHLSSIVGLRTDGGRVEKLATELEAKREAIRQKALAWGFYREEKKGLVKNTKVLQDRVREAYMGAPPTTEKGAVSIARETLENSGDKQLVEFAEVSNLDKLFTYIPTLRAAAKAPLNTKCNILLATGRTSYDGLVQIFPRKGGVRECFEFRGLGSSVDYPALEAVTLAQSHVWLLGRSSLGDAINAGEDIHSSLAAQLIGVPYSEFVAGYEANAFWNDIRQACKAANFGFPGMMGPAKFVEAKAREGMSICSFFYKDGACGHDKVRVVNEYTKVAAIICKRCLTEAEKLREAFLKRWAEMRPYWNRVMQLLRTNDNKIVQFVSKRVRGGLSGPQAANTFFQGLGADGAKRAVIQMTKEMYLDSQSDLFCARLVNFAHDETIIDTMTPRINAHKAAMRQAQIMYDQMRLVTPDIVFKMPKPVLMKHWYKGAKQVFNERGELQPWVPKTPSNV